MLDIRYFPFPIGDLISHFIPSILISGVWTPLVLLLGISSTSFPISVNNNIVLYSCFSKTTPLGGNISFSHTKHPTIPLPILQPPPHTHTNLEVDFCSKVQYNKNIFGNTRPSLAIRSREYFYRYSFQKLSLTTSKSEFGSIPIRSYSLDVLNTLTCASAAYCLLFLNSNSAYQLPS